MVASEEDLPLDLGDRFVRIDCTDPEASARAIVAAADTIPLDAVVAADDRGVLVAALATQKLGLPGHPPSAAAATRDKLLMRQALARVEILQPAFAALLNPTGEDLSELSYPLVIKPRTGSASRGVVRVDRPEDLAEVTARVRSIAEDLGETGPLLAEAYVPGDEVAVEGLVVNGATTVLAVFDKPDPPEGPVFPESLLVTPSSQPEPIQLELARTVEVSVRALGLHDGPIHAEARIDPTGRVHLLEIAARSIGGLCGRSLRFGLTNAGLEEQILAAALGRPVSTRQPRASGVIMLNPDRGGVLLGVDGVEEVEAMPGVTEVDITTPPGTQVEPLPEGDRYLGFVFGVADTAAGVATLLRAAAARLTVRIE